MFQPTPRQETARGKPTPEPVEAAKAQATDDDKPQSDLAELAESLNTLYKENQAGASQSAESAEYSLDRILATLNKSPQRGAAGPNVSGKRSKSRASGASDTEQPDVLNVVDRLHQISRQLMRHDEPASGPSGAPGRGKSAQPEASLRELLIALDGLPLANRAAPGSPTLPPLADQIDARIASTSGENRRLAQSHRRILDTTSNLFARAREDFVPSSDVESLVKRLERPLLKLALQDKDFPNLPDHPARQVLNLIEQYAVAADDKGKFFDAKLQRFLYLLVDRVCSRADDDPGIFELVRDSLEKVLLPILQIRRTRVARLQEASEGQGGDTFRPLQGQCGSGGATGRARSAWHAAALAGCWLAPVSRSAGNASGRAGRCMGYGTGRAGPIACSGSIPPSQNPANDC